MRLRWLSAIGGIILIFSALIFGGNLGLALLSSVAILLVAIEYTTLFEKPSAWFAIFLSFVLLVYVTEVAFPLLITPVLTGGLISLITLGIIMFHEQSPKAVMDKLQWSLWGLVYVGFFPGIAIRILVDIGWAPYIFLLVTVFVGDTFAFFAGRAFGGRKIFPNISPKKTVSGAIGGLAGSTIIGTAYLWWFARFPADLGLAIALSFCIGIFGQFGDFFESLVKRVSDKKDSSQWLPGHGGFLDRLDGVYFSSVVLYFFCYGLGYLIYF